MMQFEFCTFLGVCSLGTQYFTVENHTDEYKQVSMSSLHGAYEPLFRYISYSEKINIKYTHNTLIALHNIYGPAFIGVKGREKLRIEHYVNGQLHRELGPAVIIFENPDWINLDFFVGGKVEPSCHLPFNAKLYKNTILEEKYKLSESTTCKVCYLTHGTWPHITYMVGNYTISEKEWVSMGLRNVIVTPFKLNWALI